MAQAVRGHAESQEGSLKGTPGMETSGKGAGGCLKLGNSLHLCDHKEEEISN